MRTRSGWPARSPIPTCCGSTTSWRRRARSLSPWSTWTAKTSPRCCAASAALTGEKAVQIARQLCAGLGAAHDRGVLHRDLKPANIMIDGRGQVRIADFGIAALAAQEEPSGPVPGTPAFMAPELFEGGRPSVRSDLYALGMVLYEAVTGKEPFEGKPPTSRDRAAAPARPSVLAPHVDPALETVILQCLDRDPQTAAGIGLCRRRGAARRRSAALGLGRGRDPFAEHGGRGRDAATRFPLPRGHWLPGRRAPRVAASSWRWPTARSSCPRPGWSNHRKFSPTGRSRS